MRRITSAVFVALAIVASAFTVACGETPIGPGPTPTPVTIKRLTGVSVDQASIVKGASTQVRVTAEMTNGTSKDVTSEVSLSALPSTVVSVTSSGQVTGLEAGNASVSASFSGVTLTVNVTVMAPPVTMIGLEVLPQAAITVPASAQLEARAKMSDGTNTNVTSTASWSSSDQSVATVSSGGLVTARKAGTVTISAANGGFTGLQSITILPPLPTGVTPWSELPPYPEEYKPYLREVMKAGGGVITRWAKPLVAWKGELKQVLTFWNNPAVSAVERSAALAGWEGVSDSLSFEVVADSASADIVPYYDPSLPLGVCGKFLLNTRDGAIVRLHIQLSSDPGCAGEYLRSTIAHEMGHGFGLPHTEPMLGIMSAPAVWNFDQKVVVTHNWMHKVPLGVRPPEIP